MEIARVVGSVVATAKTQGLGGRTLLVVQPCDTDGSPSSSPSEVAVDRVGAGVEELVLLARFGAARVAVGEDVEVDAAVVGIIDSIDLADRQGYRKA